MLFIKTKVYRYNKDGVMGLVTDDSWVGNLLKQKDSVKLASYIDLVDSVCMGDDPIEGKVLEVSDGVYVWDYCEFEGCFDYIQIDSWQKVSRN